MRRADSRETGDRGVTIVEAAFALPILFLFFFGLVDMGMWTFNSNQATNAARDGARAGILSYEYADNPANDPNLATGEPTDEAVILAAIQDHLPKQTIGPENVTVQCLDGDGTAVPCVSAPVDSGRIRVDVEWTWSLVTPVAGIIGVTDGAARGSATMAIVGEPVPSGGSPTPTTTPASTAVSCTVANLVVPASVQAKSNQLTEALPITFEIVGAECAVPDLEPPMRIEIDGSKANPSITTIDHVCGCTSDLDQPHLQAWSYSGSNNIWSSNGQGRVRVVRDSTVLAEAVFYVEK